MFASENNITESYIFHRQFCSLRSTAPEPCWLWHIPRWSINLLEKVAGESYCCVSLIMMSSALISRMLSSILSISVVYANKNTIVRVRCIYMCGCFYCRKEKKGLRDGDETLCTEISGGKIAAASNCSSF